MVNRQEFFTAVRPIFGTLTQAAVDGMNAILDAFEAEGLSDKRWLAYILATAYWETGRTMAPVPEGGRGAGHPYGRLEPNGKAYYGRGFVQLTWKANYERAGKELGVDLVANPDLALDPKVAARILVKGMVEGWFTTHKLADYIGKGTDYVAARRIVNGQDFADSIAAKARRFDAALSGVSTVAEMAPTDDSSTGPWWLRLLKFILSAVLKNL